MYSNMAKNILQEFKENALSFKRNHYDTFVGNMRLKSVRKNMEKTSVGRAIIQNLEDNNVGVFIDQWMPRGQHGTLWAHVNHDNWTNGRPEVTHNTMCLNPRNGVEQMMDVLFHEARHAMQNSQMGLVNPSKLCSAEDYLWHTRMVEADAQASAVELTYKHYKETGSRMDYKYTVDHSPFKSMHKAFAKSVKKNPDNLHNGVAKREAFDTWFKGESRFFSSRSNTEVYDHNDLMRRMPGWMESIDTFKPDIQEGALTKDDFMVIGTISSDGKPYKGSNYLDLPGYPAIDSPMYREGFTDFAKNQMKFVNQHDLPKLKKSLSDTLGQAKQDMGLDQKKTDGPDSETSHFGRTSHTQQQNGVKKQNAGHTGGTASKGPSARQTFAPAPKPPTSAMGGRGKR